MRVPDRGVGCAAAMQDFDVIAAGGFALRQSVPMRENDGGHAVTHAQFQEHIDTCVLTVASPM